MQTPLIFLLFSWYPCDCPHPPLAGVVAHQHRQQLVTVEPVALGAPRTTVDFDACRIHHEVMDTLLGQAIA
ncbi:hypothetical protein D9M68_1007920 [compost metagenome]